MALDIVQPTQSKDEFPSFLGSFNTKYFDNLGFYHENHGIMIFCTKVYLAMDQSEFLSDEEIEAVLKHKLRINLVPPGATNLTLTYHDILYHWLYNLAPFFELRYLSHSAGDKSKFEDYNLFCQGKQTWSFIPRLASWKKITFYLESRCCEQLAVKQQTVKNKPKLKTKSIQQSARMSFGEVDEYLFPIILLDSSVDKLRRNEDLWTTEEVLIPDNSILSHYFILGFIVILGYHFVGTRIVETADKCSTHRLGSY